MTPHIITDPHDPDVRWRHAANGLEVSLYRNDYWYTYAKWMDLPPTPERTAMWIALQLLPAVP